MYNRKKKKKKRNLGLATCLHHKPWALPSSPWFLIPAVTFVIVAAVVVDTVVAVVVVVVVVVFCHS